MSLFLNTRSNTKHYSRPLAYNMAAAPTPILDHIVILVPHSTLLSLPSWLTEAFTVLQGGRHAGGVTENKLILFQDGVYLELIAFIPGQDDGRNSHRWGQRREGHIVDWANSLDREEDLEVIRQRVGSGGSGIKYSGPTPGGRVRPDGTELKWVISAPYIDDDSGKLAGGFVGGEAPFWCLDRTPRHLRVPYQVKGNVEHASGALGVVGVTITVRDEGLFGILKKTYDALQGHDGTAKKDSAAAKAFSWRLQVPEPVAFQGVERTLTLALADGSTSGSKSQDVYVELSLGSSTQEEALSGYVGDESWLLKFDVHKV